LIEKELESIQNQNVQVMAMWEVIFWGV
jgi:hypothetical protein